MKKFVKENISYDDSTKNKIGIYGLIIGLFGVILGSIIVIFGIMQFLGNKLIPIEIEILRNPNLASIIIAVILFPELENTFLFLEILAEIDPYNKAYKFVWETPIFIYDIIKPDIFLGLLLIIIGIVFLSGIRDLFRKRDEGVGHIVVGSMLSLGFGVIYFLIFLAHGAMFLLGNEEFLAWNPLSDFGPVIWLAFLSIPGGIIAWQIKDVK